MAAPGADARPPAVLLMGPTASGKTDLALALAERFAVDLVSADSALVYRGLDIGAAKPDAATLARHPHALVDIREPDQPFSAGEFRTLALAAMTDSVRRGRMPLVVSRMVSSSPESRQPSSGSRTSHSRRGTTPS